jgi:tRNA-Thr(GGU) m(6)t(6)A37 methyltransferase TsaA
MPSINWTGLSLSSIAVAVLVYSHYMSVKRRKKQASAETIEASLSRLEAELTNERKRRVGLEQTLKRQEMEMKRRQQQNVATPSTSAGKSTASSYARDADIAHWTLRPIGHVQSCFIDCQGTPRQPGLVPAARAQLVLDPSVSEQSLEGLEQNSHVWVIFIFNKTGDFARAKINMREQQGYTFPAKVRPPRAGGLKVGCLATRTPHRPNPIGLSLVRLERRVGRMLLLSGADLVDGTPVLDLKVRRAIALAQAPLDKFLFPWTDPSPFLYLAALFGFL